VFFALLLAFTLCCFFVFALFFALALIFFGSLPIGILFFSVINFKILYKQLLNHKLIVIYLILVSILNYFFTTLHSRVLIERVNLILFFLFVDAILYVGRDLYKSIDKIEVVKIFHIIACICIVLWILQGDFTRVKGGLLFPGIHSYNFEQYGCFLIYYLFIISGYIIYGNSKHYYFTVTEMLVSSYVTHF
jgi:hypothetical protein